MTKKDNLVRCSYCDKPGKIGKPLKKYIIADDLENPKLYHKDCMMKFRIDILTSKNYCPNCKEYVTAVVKLGGRICPECRRLL